MTRRKDLGQPGNGGKYTSEKRDVHYFDLDDTTSRPPVSGNARSRMTAIELITGPLAPHRDALTLAGGQAVLLRTVDRFDLRTETEDADFAITPQLVSATPGIEDALRAAGFQPRIPDRPGLWGRNPIINETGRTIWTEQFDLDCPAAY